jgi:hypothetical protein
MEATNQKEYETVQAEIFELRECITSYMKMFFQVGIGVIGLFSYLATQHAASNDDASLNQQLWPYVPLALAEIIIYFSTILFHKFNTHNRSCGYLRALELEKHRRAPTISAQPDDIRLWESVLAVPFQPDTHYQWGRIKDHTHVDALSKKLKTIDSSFIHPSRHVVRNLRSSLSGLWLICRSSIYRAQTNSWTFPSQVAFGPLIVTILLVIAWAFMFNGHLQSIHPVIECGLLVHIIMCWLGLGYRMVRLSANNGDRTIETWCWRAIVQRYGALQCQQLQVEYAGWLPTRASEPV